jgi:hypothetical protein
VSDNHENVPFVECNRFPMDGALVGRITQLHKATHGTIRSLIALSLVFKARG